MTVLVGGIVGRDLDPLVRFYTEVMGFAVVHAPRLSRVRHRDSLRRDDARLELFFPGEPAAVDALAAAVAAGGGRVLREPSEHRPGARMAVVTDPEHNRWELLYDPDVEGRTTP